MRQRISCYLNLEQCNDFWTQDVELRPNLVSYMQTFVWFQATAAQDRYARFLLFTSLQLTPFTFGPSH